jgi:hypothetical protein
VRSGIAAAQLLLLIASKRHDRPRGCFGAFFSATLPACIKRPRAISAAGAFDCNTTSAAIAPVLRQVNTTSDPRELVPRTSAFLFGDTLNNATH